MKKVYNNDRSFDYLKATAMFAGGGILAASCSSVLNVIDLWPSFFIFLAFGTLAGWASFRNHVATTRVRFFFIFGIIFCLLGTILVFVFNQISDWKTAVESTATLLPYFLLLITGFFLGGFIFAKKPSVE